MDSGGDYRAGDRHLRAQDGRLGAGDHHISECLWQIQDGGSGGGDFVYDIGFQSGVPFLWPGWHLGSDDSFYRFRSRLFQPVLGQAGYG